MKKIFLILILCSVVFLNAKTWVREYTYNASEADSKLTSRAISLEQVKRLLLQEIGVYVHSTILNEEVEVSGELRELTAKQIEIISAGITETKIIEENWNGETYYIKAEITADENDVINRLDNVIADKEKTKQLEESRKRTEEALAEIKKLKQQLAQTKNVNEKLKIQKDYNVSSNQLTAEDWFQKGYNSAEIGEYDDAILYYQKSIELYPYAEAYLNIGVIYADKGNYDKAIECFQKAIEINPDYAGAYYNMGRVHADKGYYIRAIRYWQKAVKINPDYADAFYNMGNAYVKENNYNKAIESYQKAIEINPDFADAYHNIGFVYNDKGNYDKAIECYQKAIEINPDYAKAYFSMGIAYHDGNIGKAFQLYEKAAILGNKEAQDYLRENGISW